MDRFSKWNEHAKEVLRLADKETRRLQQKRIDCGHLLLGILSQEQGTGIKVLQSFEIDMERTCKTLEQKIGIGEASTLERITPKCKQAIELAVEEASRCFTQHDKTILFLTEELKVLLNLILHT